MALWFCLILENSINCGLLVRRPQAVVFLSVVPGRAKSNQVSRWAVEKAERAESCNYRSTILTTANQEHTLVLNICECRGRNKDCPFCRGSGQPVWSVRLDQTGFSTAALAARGCPMCNAVPMSLEVFQRHLEKQHLGQTSSWPRHRNKAKPAASGRNRLRRRSFKKSGRALKRAQKSAGLPAANVGSSLGRLRINGLSQKPPLHEINSDSIRTISGGLPDSNRSKH